MLNRLLMGPNQQIAATPASGSSAVKTPKTAIEWSNIDKVIQEIEQDVENWNLEEAKEETAAADDLAENSEEDLERIKQRQAEENHITVKIERIVERAMTLYNTTLFMPSLPPPEKTARTKNVTQASTAPSGLLATPQVSPDILQQHARQQEKLQQLAMEALKKFVRRLRRRRNAVFEDPSADPYLRVPWNTDPDILSHELYMYPTICWAVLLLASAERQFQESVQFHQALKISRGNVVISSEDYQKQFEEMESLFAKAVEVINAARFHGGDEDVDGSSPRGKASKRNSLLTSTQSAADALKVAIPEEVSNLAAEFKSVKGSKAINNNSSKSRHNSSISPVKSPNKRAGSIAMAKTPASRRASAATSGKDGDTTGSTKADDNASNIEIPKPTEIVSNLLGQLHDYEHQLTDSADLSIVKDSLLNLRQFSQMDNDMRSNRKVMASAAKTLTRNGVKDFNAWTGQLTTPELPSLFPTTNTGPKNPSGRPVNVAGRMRDPTTVAGPVAAGTVTAEYNPSKSDPMSLRAEMMVPLRTTFGSDEAAGWIHWALASVGGISMGFLGHACISVEEMLECIAVDAAAAEANKNKAASNTTTGAVRSDSLNSSVQASSGPRLPDAFLVEIRNRLLEVDTKLTLNNQEMDFPMDDEEPVGDEALNLENDAPEDGTDPNNTGTNKTNSGSVRRKKGGDQLVNLPTGQLESRIIVLFILIKVTAQLHWKKEILPLLLQLEKTFDVVKGRYGATIAYRQELFVYSVLLQKFRFEYDQWLLLSSELMSDVERGETLMLQLLPRAKKYYTAACEMMTVLQAVNTNTADPLTQDHGQVYLLKDAVRKLTNVYQGLGSIPLKATTNASPTKSRFPPQGSTTDSTGTEAVIPPASLDELSKFSNTDIEAKEKSDIKWLQKFGRARAQAVYRDYRTRFVQGQKIASPLSATGLASKRASASAPMS